MKKWDVILIGSGISSLTCAAILSKHGKSVCVLEQHSLPGGYLHCFKRFGLRFETGGHYVGAMGPNQPFRQLLDYAGVFDENDFEPLDKNGYDVFHFPSFSFSFPVGYSALFESLAQLFPKEQNSIARYLEIIRNTAQLFPTYSLQDTYDQDAVKTAMETPLSKVVESLTSNPKLQCLLYSYCTIHGVAPQDISLGLHSLASDSMITGPYGFKNGGAGLANSFVKTIRANGGELLTANRVTQLVLNGNRISKVVLESGEELEAEWIISGIHPKATLRLLDDSAFSPAFKSRVNKLEETISFLGVYASCKEPMLLENKKNYYCFRAETPSELFQELPHTSAPAQLYLARTDRVATGKSNYPVTFHSPSPYRWFSEWRNYSYGKRPQEYKIFKNNLALKVFESAEIFFPNISQSIEEFDVSTPLSNLHFNGTEQGSAYGIYHSIQNTGVRALGPRTSVSNLLLTGQNCLAPGMLGAATSGLRTAGSLIGIKPLIRNIRRATQ